MYMHTNTHTYARTRECVKKVLAIVDSFNFLWECILSHLI